MLYADWEASIGLSNIQCIRWTVCPRHTEVRKNESADVLTGEATNESPSSWIRPQFWLCYKNIVRPPVVDYIFSFQTAVRKITKFWVFLCLLVCQVLMGDWIICRHLHNLSLIRLLAMDTSPLDTYLDSSRYRYKSIQIYIIIDDICSPYSSTLDIDLDVCYLIFMLLRKTKIRSWGFIWCFFYI